MEKLKTITNLQTGLYETLLYFLEIINTKYIFELNLNLCHALTIWFLFNSLIRKINFVFWNREIQIVIMCSNSGMELSECTLIIWKLCKKSQLISAFGNFFHLDQKILGNVPTEVLVSVFSPVRRISTCVFQNSFKLD